MDQKTKRKIRRIAYKVRRDVEVLAKKEPREINKDTMGGMCARASAMLSNKLSAVGIEHKIAYSQGHVYIECDGHVVDVTATQFRDGQYGKTLIRPIEQMEKSYRWKKSKTFFTPRGLFDWQNESLWPKEQKISKHELDY